MVLCSELDMDYFAWILVALINVLKSPFENTEFGLLHTSNSYLDLVSNSLLNQTIRNMLILLSVLIAGDIVTLLMYRLFKFCRLYTIRHVFARSVFFSCLYAPAASRSVINPFLGLAHLLK
mmetsp:Transcript_44841/g.51545  ORF Transcript_44841/g.51545 Transcript_44841/m.51545 type:complete len:121 (+) Transcript_44841:2-364(+)